MEARRPELLEALNELYAARVATPNAAPAELPEPELVK
jgi:hypothetical protein